MSTATLPAGFESLATFVDYWACATTEARLRARSEARMEDIQAFYDAMLPLAERAIECVDASPLGELPPDVATLAQLVLSLAQAAVAVEMHGQPRSPGTPWPHSVRVPSGAGPFA